MLLQTNPIKLQVARRNLFHGLSIQVQAGYGRRLPRHGGHLQDGMIGECITTTAHFSAFAHSSTRGVAVKNFSCVTQAIKVQGSTTIQRQVFGCASQEVICIPSDVRPLAVGMDTFMLCADTLDTDTALNINDEQAVSAVALKMHVLQVSRRSVSHRNRCFGGQHQLGLRTKEISALQLWDTVTDVLEPAGRGDLIQKQKSTEADETEIMGIIEALN